MEETPQVTGFGATPRPPDPGAPAGPPWGAPPLGWPPPPASSDAGRPTRRWPRVAAVVGVAAGTAVGAAVLAGAATGGSTPDASTAAASTDPSSGSTTTTPSDGTAPAAPNPDGMGGFGGPGALGGRGRMLLGGPGFGGPVVHGQFTISAPGGGYETLQEQSGTVSSVTNTSGNTWSLVVKSADGQSFTYVVDTGTSIDGGETGISSVSTGDTVRVLGVVSGDTTTAKQVTDQTVLKNNGQSWMPMPKTPPSGGGTSSSSSGTGTSA